MIDVRCELVDKKIEKSCICDLSFDIDNISTGENGLRY
jgi:hypothetical protein